MEQLFDDPRWVLLYALILWAQDGGRAGLLADAEVPRKTLAR